MNEIPIYWRSLFYASDVRDVCDGEQQRIDNLWKSSLFSFHPTFEKKCFVRPHLWKIWKVSLMVLRLEECDNNEYKKEKKMRQQWTQKERRINNAWVYRFSNIWLLSTSLKLANEIVVLLLNGWGNYLKGKKKGKSLCLIIGISNQLVLTVCHMQFWGVAARTKRDCWLAYMLYIIFGWTRAQSICACNDCLQLMRSESK